MSRQWNNKLFDGKSLLASSGKHSPSYLLPTLPGLTCERRLLRVQRQSFSG